MAARAAAQTRAVHRKDTMAIDPGLRRLALGTLLAAFPGRQRRTGRSTCSPTGLAGHTLFGTNVADRRPRSPR